jgi:hypothetical protein
VFSATESQERERESLSRLLECSAWCLFLVFSTSILAGVIPPRFLDPAWQLRFAALAVNNGSIPLVGFLLFALASAISPVDGALRGRRDRVRQWGLAAAIGFLLLVPLQGFAAWSVYGTATSAQSRQLQLAERKFKELRQVIVSAGSDEELQAGFQRLQGPAVSPGDLAQPMSKLRQQLLSSLDAAQARVRDQLRGPGADRVWLLVQDTLRVMLSSLGYSLAFAAGSYLPGNPEPLLDQWSRWLQEQRARRQAARRQRETSGASTAPTRKDVWKPRRAPGQDSPSWLDSLMQPLRDRPRSGMPRPRRPASRNRSGDSEYWRQLAAEDRSREQERDRGRRGGPDQDDNSSSPDA